MKMKCPNCDQPLEGDDDLVGQNIQCPACSREFTVTPASIRLTMPAAAVPAPAAPPVQAAQAAQGEQSPLDLAALRDPKEKTAYGCLTAAAVVVLLLLVVWIVSSAGMLLIAVGAVILGRWMAGMFAAAYIKTNAVEVSEWQFPEINSIARAFALRVGKPQPTIYVMQANVWNAFAMRVAGNQLVVLLSGAVDSLLLRGSMRQVAFLVGHEIGHHYAGHLDFWRRTIAGLGSVFVWLGMWYSRRRELTCDRYGLACANSLSDSLRAVCNMAVGAHMAPEVDVDLAISQWKRHQSEFFVKYRTIYSSHPHTLWRLEALRNAADQLGIGD